MSSVPQGWKVVQLSSADQCAPPLQTPVVYCFDADCGANATTQEKAAWWNATEKRLRAAFDKTVNTQFPFTRGHLVRDTAHKNRGRLMIAYPPEEATQGATGAVLECQEMNNGWTPSAESVANGNCGDWPIFTSSALNQNRVQMLEKLPAQYRHCFSGATSEEEEQTQQLSPDVEEEGQAFVHGAELEGKAKLVNIRLSWCHNEEAGGKSRSCLVLVGNFHHSIFDGASIVSFINCWAEEAKRMKEKEEGEPQAQHNEEAGPVAKGILFDPSRLMADSESNAKAAPLDKNYRPIFAHEFFGAEGFVGAWTSYWEHPSVRSSFSVRFRFSEATLCRLQKDAAAQSGGSFTFSKNDVLVAYLWRYYRTQRQRIYSEPCQALSEEMQAKVQAANGDESVTYNPAWCYVPVGLRTPAGGTSQQQHAESERFPGVPEGYIGNALFGTLARMPCLHDLLTKPFHHVAAKVQKSIQSLSKDPAEIQRILQWEAQRQPPGGEEGEGKNKIRELGEESEGDAVFKTGFISADSANGFDLFSSWRNFPLYGADFGLGGKGTPKLATVVLGMPLRGVFYFVPQPPPASSLQTDPASGTGIDVVFSLEHIKELDQFFPRTPAGKERGGGGQEKDEREEGEGDLVVLQDFLGDFCGFVVPPGPGSFVE